MTGTRIFARYQAIIWQKLRGCFIGSCGSDRAVASTVSSLISESSLRNNNRFYSDTNNNHPALWRKVNRAEMLRAGLGLYLQVAYGAFGLVEGGAWKISRLETCQKRIRTACDRLRQYLSDVWANTANWPETRQNLAVDCRMIKRNERVENGKTIPLQT